MRSKDFEAEFLRRVNALHLSFIFKKEYIQIERFRIEIGEPVPNDDRKCVVKLFERENLKFEKPCTSYYLLQYITSKLNID